MPIMVKETGGAYTPAPAGVHVARCCDVVDLGVIESKFKDDRTGETKRQHKVRIVWQISDPDEQAGKRLTVSKQYTASLNEKATLRHDLESWRGRPFSREELAGFDLERLIGVAVQVNVVHETRDGRTYANVKAVMGVPKALAAGVPPVEGYTRVKDRTPEQAEPGSDLDDVPTDAAEFAASDEDIPF